MTTTTAPTSAAAALATPASPAVPAAAAPVRRFTTASLMQDQREVEIEHGGRIYRLRITQLNKLILTA